MQASFELRRTLVLLAGLAALLGATGITQAELFHQASTLKYALTVAGPLFVIVLALSASPVVLIAGLLVIAAPFAGFSMTFSGMHVPLLAPIAIIGALITGFSASPNARRSALAAAGVLLLGAFALPIIDSPTRTDVLAVLASLFLGAYLASRASLTSEGFVALVWAFVISAVIQAGLALWEHSTGHLLNLYGSAGGQVIGSNYFFGYLGGTTRPPGAFYDPISLGNMLAIAVPLSTGLAIFYGRLGRWVLSLLGLLALVAILVGLEVTLSRMSWIGATVGLVVVGLLAPPAQRRIVLSVLVVTVGAAVALGVFGGQSVVLGRLGSITHPLNESGTGNGDVLRVAVWSHAISIATRHPAAGIGLGRLGQTLASQFGISGMGANAQSTYLQVAAEAGLLGVAGLLAVLMAIGHDLARLLRADRLWGAVLAGSFLAVLICWTTDVTIRYSGVAACMGVLFGMIAGSARRVRAEAATGVFPGHASGR